MRTRFIAMLLSAAAVCGCQSNAGSEHSHGEPASGASLGDVQFDTTCAPPAQKAFNQGMVYQHSFWYRAARREFERALADDPGCAIAYWGIAQSLLLNPFGPPPPQSLPEGLALLEKAGQLKASPRELAYIGALKDFYADHDKRDHRTRVQAYLRASADLARRYPDDDEAQIYYALALNVAASPNDKTYALPLQAAAILEPIMQRRPRHPGVAHYLVHSYDYPPIAGRGVEAAKRYAQIAGASPHALHMPSHIFTRAGYWDQSIAANLRSAEVARADKEPDDELHAMDYLVYAYLQRAQDGKARATVERMAAVTGVNAGRHTGPFAIAASEARYALERSDWSEAERLPARPTRFAHVEAITHFARALGAARSGNVDSARASAMRVGELRDRLLGSRDAYWAEQVGIAHDVAQAWILHAQGSPDDALRLLQKAADAEDATDKHVVTPGPLIPAREMYGSMLLQMGRSAEALAAFEQTLRKEPGRLNTTLGAARAAQLAGEPARARQHYEAARALAAGGDGIRTGLTEAEALRSAR